MRFLFVKDTRQFTYINSVLINLCYFAAYVIQSVFFSFLGSQFHYFIVNFLLFVSHGNNLNRWSVFADVSDWKMQNLQLETKKLFASVSMGEEKPFDFFRILFGMSSLCLSFCDGCKCFKYCTVDIVHGPLVENGLMQIQVLTEKNFI